MAIPWANSYIIHTGNQGSGCLFLQTLLFYSGPGKSLYLTDMKSHNQDWEVYMHTWNSWFLSRPQFQKFLQVSYTSSTAGDHKDMLVDGYMVFLLQYSLDTHLQALSDATTRSPQDKRDNNNLQGLNWHVRALTSQSFNNFYSSQFWQKWTTIEE